MSINSLVTEEQLKEWLGFDQRARIEQLLKDKRIPYFPGKDGRICTTLEAINNHLLEKRHESSGFTFKRPA